MTSLQAELDPKIAALRAGLENHIKEYISTAEQMTKQSALMQEMQPKWGPVLEKLRADFDSNWAETRANLRPITDLIAAFVTKYGTMAHETVAPYYGEFRDQAVAGIGKAREADTKVVEQKLRELIDALQATFQ